MKILIASDIHGDTSHLSKWSKTEKPDAVIVTGDIWDMIGPQLGIYAPEGVHLIRGNHESEPRWSIQHLNEKFKAIKHEDFTAFELGGKKFGVIGRMDEYGFESGLDKHIFLGHSNRSFEHKPFSEFEKDFEGIDVLLCHDAPWCFQGYGFGRAYMAGSQYLARVLDTFIPELCFHGHHHKFADKQIYSTRVISLAPADHQFDHRTYAILNTENMNVRIEHEKDISGLD